MMKATAVMLACVGANDMPVAELDIGEDLVRALLAEQHADLADRPLRQVANGWDNVLFRLGDDLVVRLPRRAQAAPLVEHEHRWLPTFAPRLPLPIPVPLRQGRPSDRLGFPWAWSVCPWFDGSSALVSPPVDGAEAAEVLGAFLAALHQPAPHDAPGNPFRGVPLAQRDPQFRTNLATLGSAVDGHHLAELWEELSSAPPWDGPNLWVHGDVHPGNLVVRDGRLRAVIDFGDLTAGDRVSDLVVGWMLFDTGDRARFRGAAGAERAIDEASWTRARAWALALGVAILANSADNPTYAAFARRTLEAVVGDG
jgi:aminoglycoside phosphotransferase (APT) family kinase protein